MAALTSLALGATALSSVGGAVSGAMGSNQESSGGLKLGAASGAEILGSRGAESSYRALNTFAAEGPGALDVRGAKNANKDLARMLGQYSQTGGLPNANDISTGQNLAGGMFGARRESLNQDFTNQNTEAERLAARLGRPVNDPIIQAKLRTGFMNQNASLMAEQSDFGNQLALQMPGQRLGFAQQRAGVLDSLAGQAFSNRAAILSMGSQLANSERQFRINTADKWGNVSEGGGLGGAITGGLAGLGGGLDLAGKMGGMFGGGGSPGGGMQAPSLQNAGFTGASFGQSYQSPGHTFQGGGMAGVGLGMPSANPVFGNRTIGSSGSFSGMGSGAPGMSGRSVMGYSNMVGGSPNGGFQSWLK